MNYGDAPVWLASLEYVKWNRTSDFKDLRKVQENWRKMLIIDDMENYILPEQKCNWIQANPGFNLS